MKQQRLSIISTLVFILFFFICKSSIAFADEALSTENLPAPVTSKNWVHDLYFESYSSTFTNNLVHFQKYEVMNIGKYQVKISEKWSFKPYFSFRNYLETTSQNMQLEFGFKNEYSKNLTLLLSVQKEKINLSSTFWSAKLGLIYGEFFQFPWEKTYAEVYFESYALQPDGTSGYLTGAGWSKLGYRQFAVDHHIFDPAVLMLRGFDTNVKSIAGADYRQLALGMQYKFFIAQPESGLTVFLSKTWNSSSSATTFSEYWFLFAMEVKL